MTPVSIVFPAPSPSAVNRPAFGTVRAAVRTAPRDHTAIIASWGKPGPTPRPSPATVIVRNYLSSPPVLPDA